MRQASRELRDARAALRLACAELQTAVDAREMGLAVLHDRIVAARKRVKRAQTVLAKVRHKLAIERATANHDWMPLIRDVAAREHISARGLYKLMYLESGCRPNIRAGQFYGFYMYLMSTWKGAWNPWRSQSIYDPEAQIRATARAIKRGWGPRMWPNTYPMAF
jgi:hypothetical protein